MVVSWWMENGVEGKLTKTLLMSREHGCDGIKDCIYRQCRPVTADQCPCYRAYFRFPFCLQRTIQKSREREGEREREREKVGKRAR